MKSKRFSNVLDRLIELIIILSLVLLSPTSQLHFERRYIIIDAVIELYCQIFYNSKYAAATVYWIGVIAYIA